MAKATGPKGIDWDAQPLGKEPDSVIAARLGVARASVGRARHARGIQPVLQATRFEIPAPSTIFGRWTVVGAVRKGGSLKVRCACGFDAVRTTHSIVTGQSTGCMGCATAQRERAVAIGDRFGHWTIVAFEVLEEPLRGRTKLRRKARVRCTCGTERFLRPVELKEGMSASCGCSKPAGAASPFWKGYGRLSAQFFNRYKKGAQIRGIAFNLSAEEAWRLFIAQRGRCALSGRIITLPDRVGQPATASLDRIDSSGAYVLGNVAWVHKHLNMMKRDLPNADFIALCEEVVAYQRALREARERPAEVEPSGQVRLLPVPMPEAPVVRPEKQRRSKPAPGSEPSE